MERANACNELPKVMIGRLFSALRKPSAAPRGPDGRIPDGQRVYAVGDIHGRYDLLQDLLQRIDADDAERPDADTTLIFLGDLVDRGPDSAQVVERLMELSAYSPAVRFLLGNHEEVMLKAIEGDRPALRMFDRIGGRATMISYGLAESQLNHADFDTLETLFRDAVPASHVEFLRGFEDIIVIGDYAFVHAGIDPNQPLEAQRPADLRWIRDKFLRHGGLHEKVIVHGHTVTQEVDWCRNRIGIDTGAYATNRLTALGLEADRQWVIQAAA